MRYTPPSFEVASSILDLETRSNDSDIQWWRLLSTMLLNVMGTGKVPHHEKYRITWSNLHGWGIFRFVEANKAGMSGLWTHVTFSFLLDRELSPLGLPDLHKNNEHCQTELLHLLDLSLCHRTPISDGPHGIFLLLIFQHYDWKTKWKNTRLQTKKDDYERREGKDRYTAVKAPEGKQTFIKYRNN